MCGIVGILGNHEVAPVLVEALKRLEYRGYDSAGIATVSDGKLDRRRAVGKLVNLSDRLVHEPLAGKSGIGHTRWATHGAPVEKNAHPHRSGQVAVVHNGIIENFQTLKDRLESEGHEFLSDTDSEVIAHLVSSFYDGDLEQAVKRAITLVKGTYGIVAMHADAMFRVIHTLGVIVAIPDVGHDKRWNAEIQAFIKTVVAAVLNKEIHVGQDADLWIPVIDDDVVGCLFILVKVIPGVDQ